MIKKKEEGKERKWESKDREGNKSENGKKAE